MVFQQEVRKGGIGKVFGSKITVLFLFAGKIIQSHSTLPPETRGDSALGWSKPCGTFGEGMEEWELTEQSKMLRVSHRVPLAPWANERGAVLIIALLALMILSVWASVFLIISKTELDISYNTRDLTRALYIADAGLERFKRDLLYAATYPGTDTSGRYLASPAPAEDGTLQDDIGTYVKGTAPVRRYYDLGAPLGATFMSLSAYQRIGLNGGKYSLRIKKDSDGGVIVQSVGTIGTRVARTLEAKLEVKNVSPWENAVFAAGGTSGAFMNGCARIAGSVHILGNFLTSADTVLDLTSGGLILNQYSGIHSMLDGRLAQNAAAIAALPGKLQTEYRVRRGMTLISSSGAGVGEATSRVKGVFTNDGFGGSNASEVYSDTGRNRKYDLPAFLNISFPLPDTTNPPLSNALDITGTLPSSGTSRKLDSTVASFGPLSDAHGNSISWAQGTRTLTLYGAFKIIGNLDLAEEKVPLFYLGKGTLYVTGNVNVHDCLLPAATSSFPVNDAIGIIAGNDIEIATGSGERAARVAGAFYAQNSIRSNKPIQTAGTLVAQSVDLGGQIPSVFQVPLLAKNLPPGMPGSTPRYFVRTVYWREKY